MRGAHGSTRPESSSIEEIAGEAGGRSGTEEGHRALELFLEDAKDGGDARFAADWVESRARSKALGPIRLEAELKRKAIDEEAIQAALAAAEPGDVEERALAEAARWLKGASAADPDQRNRLAGRLQRLGYDWDTIRQVLAALAANMVA
jgi:SOS response regulatory protein OraA/RecX